MGWFSDLLLPGRLRTGPTVLLPARPDPKTLLAIAQLADPEAVFDGDDIIAGGSRVLAAIELTGPILAKLGIQDEERLWACRVIAEGPLPVDFFDKSLAEGIAFRLGGWTLCRGDATDPAESERRDPVVYLPAAPSPEEIIEILRENVSPAESLDTDRWPDGELVDGIVRVPLRQGALTDVYMGADTVVTIEEGRGIPPAARVRWPYLTEIVIAKVSPLTPPDAGEPAGTTDGHTSPVPEAGDASGDEAAGATPGEASGETSAETSGEAPGVTSGEASNEAAGEAPGAASSETSSEASGESAGRASGTTPVSGEAPDAASGGASNEASGVSAAENRRDVVTETVAEGADESLAEAGDDAASGGGETESPDEEALIARGVTALALAQRLRGIAADERGFQLAEPADLLPGRYA